MASGDSLNSTKISASAKDADSRAPLGPLLPLYLVVFIAFVGYAMMVTLFVPMLMHDHGFLPVRATTAERTSTAGFLLAMYPAGQFFGSPIIGALSDRFGRKRVMQTSLLLSIGCYVLIATALQLKLLPLLFIGCLLGGLSESNVAISQSAIADESAPQDRGRLFGYIYTAVSLAYVTGPLIGGQIAVRLGYAAPFWIVIALLVAAMVWLRLGFKESHVTSASGKLRIRRLFTGFLTVFTDQPVRRLYLVNFLFYLTIFGFWRVILMYMADEWNMPVDRETLYYAYISAMALIANLWFMPRLSRRISLKTLTIAAAILAGVGMAFVVVPRPEYSLLFTAGPASFFMALTLSGCAALLSGSVSEARQGSVMGNNQAIQVGAESIGAAVGGLLAAVLVPLPILVFGGLLVLGALLLYPARFNGIVTSTS